MRRRGSARPAPGSAVPTLAPPSMPLPARPNPSSSEPALPMKIDGGRPIASEKAEARPCQRQRKQRDRVLGEQEGAREQHQRAAEGDAARQPVHLVDPVDRVHHPDEPERCSPGYRAQTGSSIGSPNGCAMLLTRRPNATGMAAMRNCPTNCGSGPRRRRSSRIASGTMQTEPMHQARGCAGRRRGSSRVRLRGRRGSGRAAGRRAAARARVRRAWRSRRCAARCGAGLRPGAARRARPVGGPKPFGDEAPGTKVVAAATTKASSSHGVGDSLQRVGRRQAACAPASRSPLSTSALQLGDRAGNLVESRADRAACRTVQQAAGRRGRPTNDSFGDSSTSCRRSPGRMPVQVDRIRHVLGTIPAGQAAAPSRAGARARHSRA